MHASKFIGKALAEGNFYCLLALRNGGTGGRKQLFFDSQDELIDAAHDYDSREWDTFFALGAFNDNKSRKAENVDKVKAFFLDLDIGDDPKKYATRPEAIQSLRSFCKQVKLPTPTIIDSGYGVHVYWLLSEAVVRDEWLHVANALKRLLVEKDMRSDPAVTSDSARVLRIPSTHNYKGDAPKQVKVLNEGGLVDFDEFARLIGIDTVPVPTKVGDSTSAFIDALHANKENSFKDIMKKTAAGRGCEQLKIIATDQSNTSEPMWRAGLSITKFCTDGEKAAHVISQGHPEYTATSTKEKYELIKGPYTCSTFDDNNEGICPDCPNWGKVKSPIVLGSKIKEAETVVQQPAVDLPNAPLITYVIPTYPKPYFRGANGGVYLRTSNADGDTDEELIYHNDLYVVRRLRDVEVGEAIVMRLHLPKDGVREFTVPLTAITSKEEFRKHMSAQGVAVIKMEKIMQYTTTWINELQESAKADEAHRQFGWTSDACEAFILGNQEIKADSITFNPPSTQTAGLFPAFEPKGSLQKWKDTINFYNRDGMELHQYVVGTGFGSVLMEMQPLHCAALHVHSKDSGLGKTTAMIAGASIWGNPDDLLIQERDTYATKMNRGEVYHSVPLYMDELTNSHGSELSDLAYQLTSGRQRGRMKGSANEERVRGRAWKLLAVTTGNTSLVERVSMFKNMPKAEAQRVLECHATKFHFSTKSETDNFSADLKENYGWAGVPFVQYVIQNIDSVRKACLDMQARIDNLAGLTAENRFWSTHVTYTLTGLFIAKKAGLIDFDLKAVEAWAIKMLKRNKAVVEDMSMSVEETLNNYIHESWGNFLRIKSTQDLRKEQGNGLDDLVIPDLMPNRELVGRYETDIKRAYLLPKPLKEWCGEQQINYTQFVQDLKDKMGAKMRKVRLTKGTLVQLPPASALVVDCTFSPDEE
ncbi:MAG: hypothetical protein CMJ25_28515 [Phycisphaerae bacterium]|nr:hypothetical protein [Phycisphaerae bacterium]|tara:strand:- start:1387 stop:4173 length:2787 start_codon:yes stop_codon:yes gene_type:complete